MLLISLHDYGLGYLKFDLNITLVVVFSAPAVVLHPKPAVYKKYAVCRVSGALIGLKG